MPAPTNFNSVSAMINLSCYNAGLVRKGGTPDGELYASTFNTLNHLTNHLQTKGLKLFTNVDTPLTLTAGLNFYPMGPGQTGINMVKPLRVVDAYFLDSALNRVPMTPLSWQEWTTLPVNNSAPGQPVNYFVDKQATFLGLYVWPAPDATSAAGVCHPILQTQVPLGTMLNDTMSYPPEWFLGVSWALTDQICTGQPLAITQRASAMAEKFMTEVEGWDVEDAETFFVPDPRGFYNADHFE